MIPALAKVFAGLREYLRKKEIVAHSQSTLENDGDSGDRAILALLRGEIERRRANDEGQTRLQLKKLCLERVALLVAAITMGAVIYYAIVAAHQRGEMIEANRLSRQALDAAERSHLFSSPTSFYIASKENTPTVLFDLQNYGRSPAYSVRYGVACTFKAGRPEFANPYLIDVVVAPGATRTRMKGKCWQTPEEQVDLMKAGSKSF